MINGVHALIYTKNVDAVRAFFRDVLGAPHVDAGHGWLVFALPPAELGVHPADEEESHELYLMCDDIDRTLVELKAKGVQAAGEISDQGWGRVTSITIADGVRLVLYEPRHPTALHLSGAGGASA
jgi:catechol 2,3-dioxygenase-like lactoylglutathione lyase family enzyme